MQSQRTHIDKVSAIAHALKAGQGEDARNIVFFEAMLLLQSPGRRGGHGVEQVRVVRLSLRRRSPVLYGCRSPNYDRSNLGEVAQKVAPSFISHCCEGGEGRGGEKSEMSRCINARGSSRQLLAAKSPGFTDL